MGINTIDGIEFDTTGLRQGYDIDAVDDLLDRISDSLDGNGTMRGEDVQRERAELKKARGGYDITQVDEALERIAGELDFLIETDDGGMLEETNVVEESGVTYIPMYMLSMLTNGYLTSGCRRDGGNNPENTIAYLIIYSNN